MIASGELNEETSEAIDYLMKTPTAKFILRDLKEGKVKIVSSD